MRRLLLLLFLLGVFSACRDEHGSALTIAVAASMQPAMEEITSEYERETGTKVVLSVGATGHLYRQAVEGAPFDLFVAADMVHPLKLADENIIIGDSIRQFATGRLVVWQRSDVNPELRSLDDLASDTWSDARIAIASPDNAPYGKASMQVLERLGVAEKFEERIVYGSNVAQAYQFARTGNTAAAFVPASLVPAGEGRLVDVPAELHEPVRHGFGMMVRTKHPEAAADFHAFLLGERPQGILARHGFSPADEAER